MKYRIHIIASGPRTGTTLLAEAMKSCFEIDAASEHEDRIFKQNNAPGDVYLTKDPGDVLVIKPFLALFENLYVIYVIRDPRDTIVSKHRSDPDKYWCGLRYWITFDKYYQAVKSHQRLITIKYEDLVRDPDSVQRNLMEKMPFLKCIHAFSDFHKISNSSEESVEALHGVRPISEASIGRWKSNLPRIAGQLQLHGDITDSLIEHGYEKSRSWLNCLNDVTPEFGDSHFPEFFSKEDLRRRKKGKYRYAIKVYLSRKKYGLRHLARLF